MARRLTKLIKAQGLPITMKQEAWLAIPEEERPWSPEAIQFSQDVLSGKIGGKSVRTTPYRASGTGKCSRMRQFAAQQVPTPNNYTTKLINIFLTGDFLHLKWQMMGLTAGWLKAAEVRIQDEDGLVSGTMDGIVIDDSILEVKSINDRGFKNIYDFGVPQGHYYQSHQYMITSGLPFVSFIYENKNDGEWMEFRVEQNPETTKNVIREIEMLVEESEKRILREPLESCIDKEGSVYRQCPFKDVCLSIRKWSDIDDLTSKAIQCA
jgi:hypothetical protein